jgi:hypothetical protein
MPFDGSAVLPGSPLAILPEADRMLTSERRAAAKLHPKPAPSAELVSLRRAEARETVIVLDLLEKLFAGGGHWIQGAYEDYAGSYCLVGGLRQIRRFREPEDKAGVICCGQSQGLRARAGRLSISTTAQTAAGGHMPIFVSSSGARGSS